MNLDRGSLVYYYSNGHSYDQRAQTEDRTHRITTDHPVIYKDIVVPGSVDIAIAAALAEKKDLADLIIHKGLRGVL